MGTIGETIQSADWKAEKHVPVIECRDSVERGKAIDVTVSVGKEIAHPNTTEHHIRWIALYFRPEGEKFNYEAGRFEFSAHGDAAKGPNEGPVHANPSVSTSISIGKPGTLYAVAFCNIHGLWESAKDISVE